MVKRSLPIIPIIIFSCCFAPGCQDAEPATGGEPPVAIVLLDEGMPDVREMGRDLPTHEDLDASLDVEDMMALDMATGREDMAPTVRFSSCETTLEGFLDDIDSGHPGRGEDTFSVPMSARREALGRSIEVALARGDADVSESIALAREAGYQVCVEEGASGERVIWVSEDPMSGDALIAVRLGDASAAVLEHPHPFFDGTFAQALPVFDAMRARALILSGHHRCSSDQASSCDGQTSVCGETSAPYPVSDPAHHDEGTFQIAHEVLSKHFQDALVVSLHGTAQAVSYASNGTRREAGEDPLLEALVSGLGDAFPEIEHRSCDAYDAALSGVWLCGTTNVQGRALRGSADACTEDGAGASGRFIHLEQPRAMRARHADVASALMRMLE